MLVASTFKRWQNDLTASRNSFTISVFLPPPCKNKISPLNTVFAQNGTILMKNDCVIWDYTVVGFDAIVFL